MKNYVVLLVVFFSWVGVAHAGVIINEVQISPTGERFIELYNSGPSQDLIGWYIQRKTAGGINFTSLVTQPNFTDKTIEAGDYFLISKNSNSDIVLGEITLTESNTIQIKNSKGVIIDKVGWGDSKDCGNSCAPNPTTGKSIQKTSNKNWIIADSTPGTINSGVSDTNSSDNSSEDNTIYETIEPIPLIKEDPLIFKITTKIISPKIAVVGIPFSLSSLTTTNRGETYNFGKFIWNFGDGMQVGVKESKPFDYIYEYPGEYILTISYFDNSFVEIPDATDRIIIKVIPSDVYISSVGTDSDPYIELENRSKYEVILSGWIIKAGNKTFVFPEGTILLQGKKIKLSPKITGFTFDDVKYVTILNPSNEVIVTYPEEKKKIVQAYGVNNSNYNNSVLLNNVLKDNPPIKDSQIINLNDLGASASDAKVDISSLTYSIIGLIVIIGLGIVSFLFIKKKKEIPDYVERGVSANDMTIIE